MPSSRAAASAAHECFSQSPPPGPAQHEHLRQIGAMRLILRQADDELHGAAQSQFVLGDNQNPLAIGDALGNLAPKRHRAVARQGMHEADGCAAFDAIEQNVAERFKFGVADGG